MTTLSVSVPTKLIRVKSISGEDLQHLTTAEILARLPLRKRWIQGQVLKASRFVTREELLTLTREEIDNRLRWTK